MTAFKGFGTTGNAAGVVTPLDHKLANAAGLVKTTTALGVRAGVFYNNNASLITGKANMSYDVSAYFIATQRSASAGVVFGGNDGTLNVTTTAAPGSNSRIDIIYHWHREYTIDGVDSTPVIGVTQGTAAASPVAPSLAAFPGAIEIGRATVGAGITATTSATITQTAPFTSVHGGTVQFRTTTEMNLWTTAILDQRALDLATGIIYRYNGSAWKPWASAAITYTPTIANLTVGNGTLTARYRFRDGMCLCEGSFAFGSTSAISASPRLTHPVTADAVTGSDNFPLGQVTFLDAGVAPYMGFVQGVTTTTADIRTSTASGTYTTPGGLSATVPFTFATADSIMWRYEIAPA